jgi:hypothetical protein
MVLWCEKVKREQAEKPAAAHLHELTNEVEMDTAGCGSSQWAEVCWAY